MLKRTKNMNLRSDHLRYIIFAGEELDPMIFKDWNEKNDETILVNMYETTETTVHATYQRRASAFALGASVQNISMRLLLKKIIMVDFFSEIK